MAHVNNVSVHDVDPHEDVRIDTFPDGSRPHACLKLGPVAVWLTGCDDEPLVDQLAKLDELGWRISSLALTERLKLDHPPADYLAEVNAALDGTGDPDDPCPVHGDVHEVTG